MGVDRSKGASFYSLLGMVLVLGLFFFTLLENKISVCYTENCLSTLRIVALSHKGPLRSMRGDTPFSTSSDKGIKKKVALYRGTMVLCPSVGDFNKVTESNKI